MFVMQRNLLELNNTRKKKKFKDIYFFNLIIVNDFSTTWKEASLRPEAVDSV